MKILAVIGIALLALLFSSCDFRQSINKDLTTGAISRGNGLSVENIEIIINNKEVKRNTFFSGEKVTIHFIDLKGFKKEKATLFPAMSMHIVKNEKDTVLAIESLLKDLENGTDISPVALQAHFMATFPYKNKEKYKAYFKILDTKGEGTFIYELPFEIEKNPLLDITTTAGVNYSNIYLWNKSQDKLVTDKKMNLEDSYVLILEGITGLNKENEKVFPVFPINITDNEGNLIVSSTNVLRVYEDKGVEAKAFSEYQIPVKIDFDSEQVINPHTLKAILKDKKSNKQIKIETVLELY